MNELAEKIRILFSDKNPTIISVKTFEEIPLNVWQYLNEGAIRYKILECTDTHVISVTEWVENSTFALHCHNDADETIFIVKGKLISKLDNLTRTAFQKLYFKANTMHKIEGQKGTMITVKFNFINNTND